MTATTGSINQVTFELTDEQRELRQLARDFASREMRPAAAAAEGGSDAAHKVRRDVIRGAAQLGLTHFGIAEEYGGGGVDPITAAIINEELSWGDLGLATIIGSAQLFGIGLAAAGGDEAQRAEWLSRMCDPEGAIGAIAFSEPHAGSDVAAVRASAVRDGDEWVLNGEKTWITGGGIADAMLIFARTGEPGAAGISCFIVEGDREGVSHQKLDLLGGRSSYTASVFMHDVRVPADRLVGEEGDGFGIAMRFFMHSRPQVGASGLGVARAAFEYAGAYANEREAFGKPIAANQGVSFMLADMGMRIEAARALVWRACSAVERGEDAGLIGSYAKAFATDVAMQTTTDAVQVLGGAGLSTDHPVGRWMRDAKVLQIVEGTNQIQRLIAGRYYRAGMFATP